MKRNGTHTIQAYVLSVIALLALLAKRMRPEMARLTLARKIAAIALTLWKKEERFDAEQLKLQAA